MKNTVTVRGLKIGGGAPVLVQSMADCSTLDTAACVEQSRRLHAAGCRLVRFTVPTRREAENLAEIRKGLDAAGLGDMAIAADVHFNPNMALIAARYTDKVRINPGNFGGAGADFEQLLQLLHERGAALRVGVNHGSLAAHVVEKLGDSPAGMVESAMEYLRVCVARGFDQVVVSMKSSNVRVMVEAYRLLERAMAAEKMAFPLHLGVTEAGDGMAARVKSAVGIGTLLAEGIGDTIRVSLTEPPENEVPVAQKIIECFEEPAADVARRMRRRRVPAFAEQMPRLVIGRNPDPITNAAQLGRYFIDGKADGIHLEGGGFVSAISEAEDIAGGTDEQRNLALAILQAARVRMSTTEYIACPGCGRTHYDLQGTLKAIKARTGHLKGVKIGVMGCIVNGPGEMADADFGYVGEGEGRITLYRGRTVVRRGIPQTEAIDSLLELIENEQHTAIASS